MSPSDPAVAIVLFAKKPEAGKVKTRLAAGVGEERAVAIYREMVEHTVTEVRKLAVDAWLYFAPDDADAYMQDWLGKLHYAPQCEGDLGDRMLAAFNANHAARTIIIGTDCPALTAEVLAQAISALDDADLVLGPTFDGGYYLIGAKEPHPQIFKDIEWSTERVFTQTMDAAMGLRVALMERLRDVDTVDDLEG